MIKRRLGSTTTGRSYHSRRRDLFLMTLTHNIMILRHKKLFYKAAASPFQLSFNNSRGIATPIFGLLKVHKIGDIILLFY
jgi:hypothetical protein